LDFLKFHGLRLRSSGFLLGLLAAFSVHAQTTPKLQGWDAVASTKNSPPVRLVENQRLPQAGDNASAIPLRRSGKACWDEAARYHGLDPWLLYAVAYVESTHNPAVISRPNRNGTYDIGLMQINSIHLPRLARYGITQSTLMDACASTYVGAWIMADNIRRYGWSWQAIAAYNVGSLNTPGRVQTGRRYASKVYAAYAKLSRQQGFGNAVASR